MAKNRNVTQVSTTALTGATTSVQSGYTTPQAIDLSSQVKIISSQWHEAMDALNQIFTEPQSGNFMVDEIEVGVEMKVEGGFRFVLSGNMATAGTMRIKLRRKQ